MTSGLLTSNEEDILSDSNASMVYEPTTDELLQFSEPEPEEADNRDADEEEEEEIVLHLHLHQEEEEEKE